MGTELFDGIVQEAAPLLASLTPSRRVLVWGAGAHGRWLMERLGDAGVGFVDANPAKQGTTIAGRPVHAIETLDELERDEIWVAVLSDAQAIRDSLAARGLREGRDFRLAFPGGKNRQTIAGLPRTLAFLDHVDLRDRDVLEVGFGGQLYLALTLLHRGARSVLATDVAPQTGALREREPEWLAYLEHLAREDGPGPAPPHELLRRLQLHPEGTGAAQLPFDDASFDVVANTGVMEHVDDPRAAIDQFARVLRPGGLALNLAVGIHDHRANDPRSPFTPWSFLEESAASWGSAATNAYHQNRWRAVDFERCYRDAGFELLRVETTRDARLTRAHVERFDPAFRDGYSLAELAELDLYLIAARDPAATTAGRPGRTAASPSAPAGPGTRAR